MNGFEGPLVFLVAHMSRAVFHVRFQTKNLFSDLSIEYLARRRRPFDAYERSFGGSIQSLRGSTYKPWLEMKSVLPSDGGDELLGVPGAPRAERAEPRRAREHLLPNHGVALGAPWSGAGSDFWCYQRLLRPFSSRALSRPGLKKGPALREGCTFRPNRPDCEVLSTDPGTGCTTSQALPSHPPGFPSSTAGSSSSPAQPASSRVSRARPWAWASSSSP